jgi:hypothetical protein
MILFFLHQAFAESQCSSLVSKKQFLQQLDSVELGFVVADLKKIDSAMNTLYQSIPCLGFRLLPEEAARYHILKGLQAWIGNDEEEMNRSFSVARKTDSQAKIAQHVFPEDHIIHEVYEDVISAEYQEISREPQRGAYSFDGYLISRRPKQTPTIFQIVDKKKILYSSYLETDAPIPILTKQLTYHKPIALGVAAISMLVGVGLQIHSQVLRIEYQEVKDSVAENRTEESMAQLQSLYEKHRSQYTNSVVPMIVSAGVIGLSLTLEW